VVARRRHRAAGGSDDPQRYGESVAVLVGDLGHAEADALVADLAPGVRRLWWRTSVELVRGQTRDLSGAARAGGPGSLERAVEVAHAKSGAYTVQRPLELGAAVAGASREQVQVLTDYGRHLGEAFALRDDLLGVFGEPALTGKPDSDDLRAGKATVLLALAEQRCTGAAAEAIARIRLHQHDETDVRTTREAMEQSGVRDEVERRVERAVESALTALDPELVEIEAVEGLTTLATDVAWRNT
jgi:geranylgeranyl diphosphate synthase type I